MTILVTRYILCRLRRCQHIIFFCIRRSLEGHYHSNAAATLALSCGMYRIRSAAVSSSSRPGHSAFQTLSTSVSSNLIGSTGLFKLSPPQDLIEESDGINVLRAIYHVDRRWSAVVSAPPLLSGNAALGTQINTAWPVKVAGNQVVSSSYLSFCVVYKIMFFSSHMSRISATNLS